MTEIPSEVLSDHFKRRLKGRRIIAGLFFTYELDPGFFEQDVLPVFFEGDYHQDPIPRIIQLEQVLRTQGSDLAVCYSAGGLVNETTSAKLDVRRIAIRHGTGVFHPKNVVLLVEGESGKQKEPRTRSLLVACMSANLTKAGWWRNVEVCHVEELGEGERTRLREDLLRFLDRVRQEVEVEHRAPFNTIMGFLRTTVENQHRSADERVHTHFYGGGQSVPEFIEAVTGTRLKGLHLEVISPYFDDAASCKPLRDLVATFEPKDIRVFLPRNAAGEGLCRSAFYDEVANIDHCEWGRLPKKVVELGKRADAGERFVHAKVYRFFSSSPRREFVFVGSANLTNAAHSGAGNVESGFLVERVPAAAPDFWLDVDAKRPREFKPQGEDEGGTKATESALGVRYSWNKSIAEVCWHARGPSPALRLEAPQGTVVAELAGLARDEWRRLEAPESERLAEALRTTSFVYVHGEKEQPLIVLVDEQGMHGKPPLLLTLSAAEILRYWSFLTQDQQTAFLAARAEELLREGLGEEVRRKQLAPDRNTLFDRFAGFFHAFASLEQAIRTALSPKDGERANPRDVVYRMFGNAPDSLGQLLDRTCGADQEAFGDVERYVIGLCARQLCDVVKAEYREFWQEHEQEAKALKEKIDRLAEVRSRLIARGGGMGLFLDWFDPWFLKRVEKDEGKT